MSKELSFSLNRRSPRRDGTRKRSPRRYFAGASFVFASIALSGCEQRFGLPRPATEQGKDVLDLWLFSLYTAFGLGVIVLGVLFYSMVRHRRRNNELPKQTEGNVALEVTYTIIPFIIVVALFLIGLKAQASAVELDDPDLTVDVTGFQWNWTFAYPEQRVSISGGVQRIEDQNTFPELVLPVNERIRFNLTAADVNHSFFIPGFLTKRDLIPGVRNAIEVTPDRTGFFIGHCAEYCGLNHAAMNFRVRVVSQPEFEQWISQQPKVADRKSSRQSAQETSALEKGGAGEYDAGH